MPVRFPCSCGRQLEVGDEYAGRQARCPECGAVVDVPFHDFPAPIPPPMLVGPTEIARPDEWGHRASDTPRDPIDRDDRRTRDEFEEPDDADDDRHRRRRSDDDDWEEPEPPPSAWNKRVRSGVTSVVIGVVWLGIGLWFGRMFIFPVILLVIGVINVIRGLTSGRDE